MGKIGFSENGDGDKSSKRLIAFSLIGAAITWGTICVIYGLNHTITATTLIKGIIEAAIWGGVIAASATVAEKLVPLVIKKKAKLFL